MATTVKVPGGIAEQIAWAQEHGFAADDLGRDITFNDDGTITLRRFVRDNNGQKVKDAAGDEWLTEPVTVTPNRPFPTHVEVTGR